MSWNEADAAETRNRAVEVVNGVEGGVPRAAFMVVATENGDMHTLSWSEAIDSVDMTEKEVMASVLNEVLRKTEEVRTLKERLESR